jgi:ribonuclease-3
MSIQEPSPRQILLSEFQDNLDVIFLSASLLDSALTHRSFLNESSRQDGLYHNERLEFLGDAVLGLVVADLLYSRLSGRPEGEMARIKSIVVSEHTLAPIAGDIGIAEALRLGRGEELSGGRTKKALLADALEAVFGALFLDQGYSTVQRLVARLLEPAISEAIEGQSKDYKTIIQEYAQKYLKTLPVYSLEKSEGPEHDRVFWVSCRLDGNDYGAFPGKTKKEAEQVAAADVHETLKNASHLAAKRLAAIGCLSA